MKIIITGATGLIGKALVQSLSDKHQFTVVGRKIKKLQQVFANQYPTFTWDDLQKNGENILKNQDLIIHLAGENLAAKRWSKSQKKSILDSRVQTTSIIAEICGRLGKQAPRLFCASAIGVYGFAQNIAEQNKKIFTERSDLSLQDQSFLAKVGRAWENALSMAEKNHVQVTRMRFAVVLSKQGGALAKMLPAFQWGFGAVLGSGKQPFSWVALDDLVRAIDFLIDHAEITGPVNIVSPGVVSQKQFAKALANALHRPCVLYFPAWFLRIMFAEMADELLLKGQNVQSEKLKQHGFHFQYGNITDAFQHVLES